MALSTLVDTREGDTDLADGPAPLRTPAAPSPAHGTGGSSPAPAPEPGEPAGDGLHFQRCRWCQTAFFRRLLCPVCASTAHDLEAGSGTGVIRRVLAPGRGGPHSVAVITMDEGYQLRSAVVGARPEAVRTGARVRLAPEATRERREPVFRLCDDPYAGPPPARR